MFIVVCCELNVLLISREGMYIRLWWREMCRGNACFPQ